MKKLMFIMVPSMMLILAGCSSSKISSSWNDKNQISNPAKFNKILVVGLFDESNRVLRRQMEDQLAEQLKSEGYEAVTSVSVYGPKSFENVPEEKALRMVNDNNIDGVITIGLVDKTKDRTYVPDNNWGPGYYRPYAYRPWGYMYRPYYMPGFRGGHYQTNINYMFETNLYNVIGKKLVYSVQTESNDPSTMGTLTYDYSRSVIKDLKKNNVLG
ncbi:MAG: hypothetical protein ABI861_07030 [Panacibacter sp.]